MNGPDLIWIDEERPIGGELHVYTEWSQPVEQYCVPYVRRDIVEKMVQEARDQAFREAAKAAGDAAVVVLMRHCFDAPALMQQARRQSVAVPIMHLIGTPHPEVTKDDG